MKKLILPIIFFLLMLFPADVFAQTDKGCSDAWISERYACAATYKQCYEACGADPGIALESCYKGCDNTARACNSQTSANFEACSGKKISTEEKSGKKITCEEAKKILASKECEHSVLDIGKLWCTNDEQWVESDIDWNEKIKERAPDYIYDFVYFSCFGTGPINLSLDSSDQVSINNQINTEKKQSKTGLPLFAKGWLDYFRNILTIVSFKSNGNPFVEFVNGFAGTDHVLCDPSTCSQAVEAVRRGTDLTEEDVISGSQQTRTLQNYKIHEQSGSVIIDESNDSNLIIKTGQDGQVFSTFRSSEDDIGGLKVFPDTRINLPPEPFRFPSQPPANVEIESGEAEFFIIGSAEKPTTRPTFTVATPNAQVVVSGTHFWVSYNEKEGISTVGVYSGKVEVKTKDGKETTVSPEEDKPGVVVVSQKLSPIKLVIAGLVFLGVIVMVVYILKRKFSAKGADKMKKLILPAIFFLLLLFPEGIFAQYDNSCSKRWISEGFACGEAYSKCYEQCGAAPGIAPESCYKACDNTSKACDKEADANFEACKNASKKATPGPEVKEVESTDQPGENPETPEPEAGSQKPKPQQQPKKSGPVFIGEWFSLISMIADINPAGLALSLDRLGQEVISLGDDSYTKEYKAQVEILKKQSKLSKEDIQKRQIEIKGSREEAEAARTAWGKNDKFKVYGGALVEYKKPGQVFFSGLFPGQVIENGMVMRTISNMTIRTPNGYIELDVYKGSDAVVEFRDNTVILKKGIMTVIEEYGQGGETIHYGTPRVEVKTIGTQFVLAHDVKENASFVQVFEGKIEVKTKEGKILTLSPDGDPSTGSGQSKPGVVVVSQKLSFVKLAIVGVALAAVLGGVLMVLRRKFALKGYSKKKK